MGEDYNNAVGLVGMINEHFLDPLCRNSRKRAPL